MIRIAILLAALIALAMPALADHYRYVPEYHSGWYSPPMHHDWERHRERQLYRDDARMRHHMEFCREHSFRPNSCR
jgi:hypothetical protein